MYLITFYKGQYREVDHYKVSHSKSVVLEALREWDKKGYYYVASYSTVEVLS